MKGLFDFEFPRALWYISGLFLFFAPFAYFEKTVSWLLGTAIADNFHAACLRVPLVNLAGGKGIDFVSVSFVSVILTLGSAFLIGPLFCRKFCAAGALPEYLSRLIPKRFQVNWQQHVSAAPVRYGFFLGFLAAPFVAGSIVCAFCNYVIFERLSTAALTHNIGVLGSTTIITLFLWLGLFGIFAQGGRGFCTYLCPAGAAQSLFHYFGAKLSFTKKLRLASDKCRNCGLCTKKCPTGSLTKAPGESLSYELLTCITCRKCVENCPGKALTFTSGPAGWKEKTAEPAAPPVVSEGRS